MLVSLIDAFRLFLPLRVYASLALPLRLPACQPASSKLHTRSRRSDICLKQFDVLSHRNTSLKWLHVVCFGISVSKIAFSLVSQHSHQATCVCPSASGHSHALVGVWSHSRREDTCARLLLTHKHTHTHTHTHTCIHRSPSQMLFFHLFLLLPQPHCECRQYGTF